MMMAKIGSQNMVEQKLTLCSSWK